MLRRAEGAAAPRPARASSALLGWGYARDHPEDMPWTELDLTGRSAPSPAASSRASAARRTNAGACSSGPGSASTPCRRAGRPECGYDDAVRFVRGGALTVAWRPADLGMSCPVAAGAGAVGMARRPARGDRAFRSRGWRRSTISAATAAGGSTAARRAAGASMPPPTRSTSPASGSRTAAGSSVAGDWQRRGGEGPLPARRPRRRLPAVRDRPSDYNAAHRDHLHLDQAGAARWGARLPLED